LQQPSERRQVAKFERTWNHETSYMHERIDTYARPLLAFGKLHAIRRLTRGREDCGFVVMRFSVYSDSGRRKVARY
jgi:hypothetical protein